jgi:hypothetical protein
MNEKLLTPTSVRVDSDLSPRGEGKGESILNFGHWNLFEIWCLGFGG